MTKPIYKNNATSRLGIDTDAASTTLTVLANEGARFPQPGVDEVFKVTLEDRRTGQIEICECTARTGDILTVVRGLEGTTAQDFLFGATVSHRLTAGAFEDLIVYVEGKSGYSQQEADDKFVDAAGDTMTGPLTLAAPIAGGHAANKLYVDTGLTGKAALVHTHPIADVNTLQAELDDRPREAPNDGGFYGRMSKGWMLIDYNSLPNLPTTFPPGPHTHPISEVTNLQTSLDQTAAAITDLQNTKVGEAPIDGQQYARQDGNWQLSTSGAYIGSDPPANALTNTFFWDCDNGGLYIHFDDGNSVQWVQVNAQGLGDAPNNGKQYVRNSRQWMEFTGLTEAPNDGKQYARKSLAWTEVVIPASLPDAPNNANFYGRKGAAWTIPAVADVSGLSAALNNKSDVATVATKVNKAGDTMTGALTVQSSVVATGGFFSNGSSGGYLVNASPTGGSAGVIGFAVNNGGIYGILGYGGYAFYGAGQGLMGALAVNGTIQCTYLYPSQDISATGFITTARGGSDVQTSSANTVMTTNGTIRRTTSSIEYKQQVEAMEDEFADKVLQLEPVFYRPGDNTTERTDWSRFGFIAEQCYAVDFRFATSEEKKPIMDAQGNYVYATVTEERPNPDYVAWTQSPEEDRSEPPPETTTVTRQGELQYDDEVTPTVHDLNAIVAALLSVVKRQGDRIAALEAR